MIAKQSIGKSFMGALNYNLKKLHLPAIAERAELLDTNFINLNRDTIRKELAMMKTLRPGLKRNTYHTSLNFSPDDNLSNRRMLTIATEYMQQMGFDNNPYFIFRHYDTAHPHCHILALRNRFDGTVVSDSQNYKRSEEVIRKLEHKYGLTNVPDSSAALVKAPKKDELEMVQRTGRGSAKMILQETVGLAMSKAENISDFIHYLESQGVNVLFNQAGTGRVSGITYFINGFKAKGQALGNQFKWHGLIKQVDYEKIRDGQEISQANHRTREKYGINPTRRRSTVAPGAGTSSFRTVAATSHATEESSNINERDTKENRSKSLLPRIGSITKDNREAPSLTKKDEHDITDRVFHDSNPVRGLGGFLDGFAVGGRHLNEETIEQGRKRKRRKKRRR